MRILQLDQLSGPHATAFMCEEIDAWLKASSERTIKALAKKAGLANATVSRLWYRETQYPRLLTIVLLLKALGYAAIRFEKESDKALDKPKRASLR